MSDSSTQDTLGPFAAFNDAAAMFASAVSAAREIELMFPADAIDDVVIAGMGSSANAGDLVVGAFWERLRKPVSVVRGYGLPGWAGERTLVIGISFSGETEETLTCVADAVDRTCPVIGISTGGKMTGFYRPAGVPVLEPPAAPDTRSAVTAVVGALVVLLERMGALERVERDLDEAQERIQAACAEYGTAAPDDSTAVTIARFLHGSLPMIWGGQSTAPIARRWADRIARDAKTPALVADFPEYTHSELAAVDGFADAGIRPRAVILRDPRHHRQIQRRLDTVARQNAEVFSGMTAVVADGVSDLARMLDLVLLGDHVALYMAQFRGIDPGPSRVISAMFDEMAVTGFGRTASNPGQ